MGADGGIIITKMIDIKKNWEDISLKLFDNTISQIDKLEKDIERYPDSEYYKGYKIELELLQELLLDTPDINNLNNDEVIELLKKFGSSCDTPYLLDDIYVITSYGDNVWDRMNDLSWSLPGISIETWT